MKLPAAPRLNRIKGQGFKHVMQLDHRRKLAGHESEAAHPIEVHKERQVAIRWQEGKP